MEYSAVIVAAGSGTRMHLGYNKAYYRMKDGRTILDHTLDVFRKDQECSQIIVVTDSNDFRSCMEQDGRIVLASGGASRQESVFHGLMAAAQDVVLIHDGARPYLPEECLEEIKKAMETEQAACLMVPCKDTIKHVEGDYIVETYERSTLRCAQTPQAFRTKLIISCMQKAMEDGYTGTDDCSLVERYSSVKIKAVMGSYENYKITTPEDLK